MTPRTSPQPLQAADFTSAFPSSHKVFVEGRRVRVPMREITLSGGEPPLRVYDTSGPQGFDVRDGLPLLRREWIVGRGDVTSGPRMLRLTSREPARGIAERSGSALRGTGAVTQLHYARRGTITTEMEFIAIREGFDPEFVRAEVARGRAIIPANINHPELEPQLRGQDQRQHRQLRRHVVHRGRSRETAVVHALGRRHGHGSLNGPRDSRDPRVDPA
jgi:phosphomethylpyrimidine synthase